MDEDEALRECEAELKTEFKNLAANAAAEDWFGVAFSYGRLSDTVKKKKALLAQAEWRRAVARGETTDSAESWMTKNGW